MRRALPIHTAEATAAAMVCLVLLGAGNGMAHTLPPTLTTANTVPEAAPVTGGYLLASAGRSDYDYDCFFFSLCEDARANGGRIGGGYRFGTFAVEVAYLDFGRGQVRDVRNNNNVNAPRDTVSLRGVGVSAAWFGRWGPVVEGSIRVGAARMQLDINSLGSGSTWQPTFGLGLGWRLNRQFALDLTVDISRGDGPSVGTSTASMVGVGLRVNF